MKKIERLEFWEEKIFTMTKLEAMEVLKVEGITESEQMLLRWCRNNEIESVRIVGTNVNGRGVLIDPMSLKAFITSKKGVSEIDKLYIRIGQLEREKRELELRNEYLEKKYMKRPKKEL